MAAHPQADDVLRVPTSGGHRLAVHLFKGPVATAPVVIVLPAMGTPARVYRPLAAALTGHGLNVAIDDQRAHGDSTPAMSKRVDFGYATMVEGRPAAGVRRRPACIPRLAGVLARA